MLLLTVVDRVVNKANPPIGGILEIPGQKRLRIHHFTAVHFANHGNLIFREGQQPENEKV